MYKVLLDSDKYLLNYGALINPLEPDVHYMTSQILSILIDFYQTSVPFSRSFFPSLDLYNAGTRKDIKVQMKCFFAEFERAAKIREIAVYRFLISLPVPEL